MTRKRKRQKIVLSEWSLNRLGKRLRIYRQFSRNNNLENLVSDRIRVLLTLIASWKRVPHDDWRSSRLFETCERKNSRLVTHIIRIGFGGNSRIDGEGAYT